MTTIKKAQSLTTGLSGLLIILLIAFVIALIKYRSVSHALADAHEASASTTLAFQDSQTTIQRLEAQLAHASTTIADLAEELRKQKNINDGFQEQIGDIGDTVAGLTKWSKLDPELLEQYSKVFFLNENYIPSALVTIDPEWTYNGKDLQFHAKAYPFLKEMLEDAKKDGIDLSVISAYRSFGTQAALKSSYTVTYGAGTANQFSADQGYSEHQLGTTVDLTTPEVGATFTGFENTGAYTWLQKHAYEYGFTLSYPENNASYVYEPWHWRFVGEDLAEDLYDDGKYFYELNQREIDPYLIEIFD